MSAPEKPKPRKVPPSELASQLRRRSRKNASQVFRQLPSEDAAQVLSKLDPSLVTSLLHDLPQADLAAIIGKMPHDQAADIIGTLPPDQKQELLSLLTREDSKDISTLMSYPPDTAGGIMSNQFITIQETMTIGECQQWLQSRAAEKNEKDMEGISYLFATDTEKKLTGIISIRDLIFRRPERVIRDIMNREVKHVRVDDDQEKIARLFEQHRFLALPVLDLEDHLVGIVPSSKAFMVLKKEATEDMQLMVGLSGEESAWTPWQQSIGRRLGWLYINLLTAFLAAAVVGLFEDTIARWTALAVFLPIVAGQGGNAGAQTLTVIIRAMALGEISTGDGKKALIKELILGLLNGLAVGIVVGVLGFWWKGSLLLGVVVGIAMVLNMIAAAASGVLIPYGLKAMKIDPALASSIFVTTVTDVAGFLFFLGLAAMGMKWFPI